MARVDDKPETETEKPLGRIARAFREHGAWAGAKCLFFRPWQADPRGDSAESVPLQYAQLRGGNMEVLGFVPAELADAERLVLRVGPEDRIAEIGSLRDLRFGGHVVRGTPFRFRIGTIFPDGARRTAENCG